MTEETLAALEERAQQVRVGAMQWRRVDCIMELRREETLQHQNPSEYCDAGCKAIHFGLPLRILQCPPVSKLDAPCVPKTSFHGHDMCSVLVGMSWDVTMPQTPMSWLVIS
eukprot:4681021-Ditylum_brightwellii.AAC.1